MKKPDEFLQDNGELFLIFPNSTHFHILFPEIPEQELTIQYVSWKYQRWKSAQNSKKVRSGQVSYTCKSSPISGGGSFFGKEGTMFLKWYLTNRECQN